MTVVINGTSGITDVNGSAAAPAITGTDTDTGVFFGTNTVSLSTGGTERVTLDANGQLGVGATSMTNVSNYKFVVTNAATGGGLVCQQAGTDKFAVYNAGNDGYYDVTSNHIFRTGGAISGTERARIDANGNFGIGTTSPSNYAGYGTLTLNGSSGGEVDFKAGNTLYADIYAATSGMYIRAQQSTPMMFWAGGSERMRIDSSGNLLVGTTSTTQSHKMVGLVANAWALQVISSFATGSQNYGINAAFSASAPNNSSNYFFQGNDTNVNRFIVYSNGGIANYSANNTNLSDSREKTNANPAGDYLAKICAIPVRTYNYIDQNLEEDAGLTLGVFAQDVQAVAPELVMESNWGTQEEPKMRLSIYQTDLQYALMKCIQEQQAIIEQLQADVAALKAKA